MHRFSFFDALSQALSSVYAAGDRPKKEILESNLFLKAAVLTSYDDEVMCSFYLDEYKKTARFFSNFEEVFFLLGPVKGLIDAKDRLVSNKEDLIAIHPNFGIFSHFANREASFSHVVWRVFDKSSGKTLELCYTKDFALTRMRERAKDAEGGTEIQKVQWYECFDSDDEFLDGETQMRHVINYEPVVRRVPHPGIVPHPGMLYSYSEMASWQNIPHTTPSGAHRDLREAIRASSADVRSRTLGSTGDTGGGNGATTTMM